MSAEPCATEITQPASIVVPATINVFKVAHVAFTNVTLTVAGIAIKDLLANVVNNVLRRKDSLVLELSNSFSALDTFHICIETNKLTIKG